MQEWYSVDFNIFTVVFLLIIFWCLEIKLRNIHKTIDQISERLRK